MRSRAIDGSLSIKQLNNFYGTISIEMDKNEESSNH
jgi:hypothetical protein